MNLIDTFQFENKKNDIFTLGEVLIDMISTEYDENHGCMTYNKFFGGSPANIAMNIKKLGANSVIAAAVGRDELGKLIIKKLEDAGIDRSCVEEVDYSTSMVLITKSKTSPVPIFYRDADYHLVYNSKIKETLRNSKIVHFSCWPISMKPSRELIESIIEEARLNNILIGFDPNFHPMIWQKGEDGREYVKSILEKVDIVKPSEDDAERLFGKDTPENQIEKFLALGVKLVIMTLGKDGVIVSDGREKVRFKTIATEVVDSTGAGDAFWSGFYVGLIRGYNIKQSVSLGSAVSAYKLKYMGAVVNLPKLEEIKQMYNL